MNLAIIGAGYVGLVTGALFADRGNKVVCIDNDPSIVGGLKAGRIHFFEPGLEELVQKNSLKGGNLSFSTEMAEAVPAAEITFLAVGTPSEGDGSFNLSYVERAAREVGEAMRLSSGFKVVACKSTVPQGAGRHLSQIISEASGKKAGEEWAYVSSPETLAEGTAIRDFSKPDRIIIGTETGKAYTLMEELYHPFNIRKERILRGSPVDAELAKLESNALLAAKVAVVNEFARIADVTPGADMDIVRRMICEDSRIGYHFMFPGPGYGGSCFPKDVQGLVCQSRKNGYNPLILSQIHQSNEEHQQYVGKRVTQLLKIRDQPRIAVWGLAFKSGTDDLRGAASIPIITGWINRGAEVVAYDPQDRQARKIFGERITLVDDQYQAAEGADALVLLTEWPQFDAPDFARLKKLMRGHQLFDLRNRWLPLAANRYGFDYVGIGRYYPLKR